MLLLFCFLVSALKSEAVQVLVEQGILEGDVYVPPMKTGTIFSFKGIPYAQKPLGKLRFQPPQPPLIWEGVRQAKHHGPICIQKSSVLSNFIIGSEDCLYLNVYTSNTNPTILMPVMFFIHGGDFITGSGNDYLFSPDFLVGYDVVLVTINYRLGALGFLSADVERAPGNAGLKDQVAALKWIQKNIISFGGDPATVTIVGQSAGGSSVGLHMISPAAKGLFIRAVSMSGTLSNSFSINFAHRERAFNIGQRLGCNTVDPDKFIDCLLDKPAEDLLTARPDVFLSDDLNIRLLSNIYFGPIVEKKLNCEDQYLTEQPIVLVQNGTFNDVDIMIGYTENEGIYATTLLQNLILKTYPLFKGLYVPSPISYLRSRWEVLDLGKEIEYAYFGSGTVTLNTMRQFIQYYTWSHYNFDIHYFLDNIVPKSSEKNRYLYKFSIYSSRNVYSREGAKRYGIYEATHGDDLPYLFNGKGFNLTLDLTSEAYQYVEKMCTLITNFVKVGNPTPDNSFGITWPNYDDNMNYVRIGDNLSIGTVTYTGQLGYWTDIYNGVGVQPYLSQTWLTPQFSLNAQQAWSLRLDG